VGPNKQHNKNILRYKTDRSWFSRLLRHLARKQSGSILTTLQPARGLQTWKVLLHYIQNWQNCAAS